MRQKKLDYRCDRLQSSSHLLSKDYGKSASNLYPLREKEPSRYDEPLEPADREYLKGISSMLSEWESEADECAYSDL